MQSIVSDGCILADCDILLCKVCIANAIYIYSDLVIILQMRTYREIKKKKLTECKKFP